MTVRQDFGSGACHLAAKPSFVNKQTHYFGTFPITGEREDELSIFCSLNYSDVNDPSFITRNINRPLGADSNVIECVFHEPSPRALSSDLASELRGYGIRIQDPIIENFGHATVGAAHKIGGLACFQESSYLQQDAADQLSRSGYFYLLQWGFPGPQDGAVKGLWAFHNYYFLLFLKQQADGYDYRALLV